MLAFPRHTFFPETELLTGAVEPEQEQEQEQALSSLAHGNTT
jgi:hypothetical protein